MIQILFLWFAVAAFTLDGVAVIYFSMTDQVGLAWMLLPNAALLGIFIETALPCPTLSAT
jgi:hypothetical protein